MAWAYAMKRSEAFTLLVPSVITIGLMITSFVLLSISMKSLPLGTAYAVWTGIGTVGALIVGIVFLEEAATPMRLLAAAFIIAGIALMRFSSR